MRTYFGALGDSAHPHSNDPQLRQVTRFQELLVVAFREFGIITDELIANERKRFKSDVVDSIENFAKRAQLRNLKFPGRFDKTQLGRIFDNFQLGILKAKESKEKAATTSSPLGSAKLAGATTAAAVTQHVDDDDRPETRIDRDVFGYFLSEVATWAGDTFIVKTGFHETKQIRVAEHELIGGCEGSRWASNGCGEHASLDSSGPLQPWNRPDILCMGRRRQRSAILPGG